jgi:hypothetical protein
MLDHRLAIHQVDGFVGEAGIGQVTLAQLDAVDFLAEGNDVYADQPPRLAAERPQARRAPAAAGAPTSTASAPRSASTRRNSMP